MLLDPFKSFIRLNWKVEHEKVFWALKPQLEEAAKVAGVTLPKPDVRITDTVNYLQFPIWKKDGYTFHYLVEGVWTIDDVIKHHPDEMVALCLSPVGELGQFCKALEERYGDDPEIELLGYRPQMLLQPDVALIAAPAKRIREFYEFKIQRSPAVRGMTCNEPASSQKQKQRDFIVALITPLYEESRKSGIKSTRPQDLNHDDIFGYTEPTAKGFVEYHAFLGQLKEGLIISEISYNNLISKVS